MGRAGQAGPVRQGRSGGVPGSLACCARVSAVTREPLSLRAFPNAPSTAARRCWCPAPYLSPIPATSNSTPQEELLTTEDMVQDSWAFNRGAVQQGNTTAICFSRRIREPRTQALALDEQLRSSGGRVGVNWAADPRDGLGLGYTHFYVGHLSLQLYDAGDVPNSPPDAPDAPPPPPLPQLPPLPPVGARFRGAACKMEQAVWPC